MRAVHRTFDLTMGSFLLGRAALDEITDSASELSRASQDAKALFMRPTAQDRRAVMDTIVGFVRERKRIMYGGYALHLLSLATFGSAFGVYEDCGGDGLFSDAVDVEFYSPTPLEDVADICRRLVANGHEYVRGKEAMHDNTFAISVEFVRLCDVTFVPESVYYKIPHAVIQTLPTPILAVHPHYAMLDIMNMLCDPFNSHWRLDHITKRILHIESHFGPGPNANLNHILPNAPDASDSPDATNVVADARKVARQFFSSRSTHCAAVGSLALAHFGAAHTDTDTGTAYDGAVAVMCARGYAEDVVALRAALTGALDKTITECEWRTYRPLLGMLDARTEVWVRGRVVAVLFDSYTRVVPSCGVSCDGLRIASFTQVLLNANAMHLACMWQDNTHCGVWWQNTCAQLLALRQQVAGSLIDPAYVMRDFYLEYIGIPRHVMRVHMQNTDERIAENPSDTAWFSFDPHRGGATQKVGNRSFAIIDGSEVAVAAADET